MPSERQKSLLSIEGIIMYSWSLTSWRDDMWIGSNCGVKSFLTEGLREYHVPMPLHATWIKLELTRDWVWWVRNLLFTCDLFGDTVSTSDYVHHPIIKWLIDDELERMWKEAVVAYLNSLFLYLPRGTEKNNQKPARIVGLRAGTDSFAAAIGHVALCWSELQRDSDEFREPRP
jgi:hypothetical protein